MNWLNRHTRSNTQATSWGEQEANGWWVFSASRGGGVDERMVGRSSATRWDATNSRCEWRKGSRMDTWGGGVMRWYVRTSRQKKGSQEERHQQTRGGSLSQGGGSVLRGREAEAVCREDERWRRRDNRGDAPTSWQTRGQWEGSVCRQEAVDHQEDKKWQQCNKRCRDNQLEAPVDKRQWHLESWPHLEMMRGGGCVARG